MKTGLGIAITVKSSRHRSQPHSGFSVLRRRRQADMIFQMNNNTGFHSIKSVYFDTETL